MTRSGSTAPPPRHSDSAPGVSTTSPSRSLPRSARVSRIRLAASDLTEARRPTAVGGGVRGARQGRHARAGARTGDGSSARFTPSLTAIHSRCWSSRVGWMPVTSPAAICGRRRRPSGRVLENALARRLQPLPPATRAALLLAAANDGELVDELTAAMGLPDDDLVLAPAEIAGVAQAGRRPAGVFSHPLLRSAIYHLASAPARRSAHARLAAVLADRWARVPQRLASGALRPSRPTRASHDGWRRWRANRRRGTLRWLRRGRSRRRRG